MDTEDVFNNLVKDLTSEDRKAMFDRLSAVSTVGEEPLNNMPVQEVHVDLEKEYKSFSALKRFFIWLQSFFGKNNRNEIIVNYLVYRVARDIEKSSPGLISFSRDVFTFKMYSYLKSLNSHVISFSTVLNSVLLENKTMFYAFLGSMELPSINASVSHLITPEVIMKNYPDSSVREIKSVVEKDLMALLEGISAEDRNQINFDILSLRNLLLLCQFPFGRCLGLFPIAEENPDTACFTKDLSVYLVKLADILFGLNLPPTLKVLHSFFIFKEKLEGTKPEEIEEKVLEQIKKMQLCFDGIRDFNKNVPLPLVLKYTQKNLNYMPLYHESHGDWFSVYKKFWFDLFEEKFRRFSLIRTESSLKSSMISYLEQPDIPPLPLYQKGLYGDSFFIKYEKTLAFISSFFINFFYQKLNKQLKLILLDGEFYKKENQEEFADVYGAIIRFPDKLKAIEDTISPGGDYYERMNVLVGQNLEDSIKSLQLNNLAVQLNRYVEELIGDICKNFTALSLLVKGVAYGNGGKYDTLSNISYIGGSHNSEFRVGIAHLSDMVETASRLLEEISSVEKKIFEMENKSKNIT